MKLGALCLTALSLPLAFAAVVPNDATSDEAYILPAALDAGQFGHDLRIRAPITPTVRVTSTTHSQTASSSVPASSKAVSSKAVSSKKSSSSSGKGNKSTISSTPASAQKLVGSFTAAHVVFGETSQSGYVLLDGKTLSVGGPNAIIAGEIVTEAKKGLLVNGALVTFVTPNPSSSSSVPAKTSSSVPANSAPVRSSAAPVTKSVAKPAPTSSSSTSTGGAAVQTNGVVANAVAVIGLVVGALIL